MSEFYRFIAEHRTEGAVDLREAMSSAHRAVRADPSARTTHPRGRRRDGGLRMLTPDPTGTDAAGTDDDTIANDPAVRDGLAWAPFILLGDCLFGVPAQQPTTTTNGASEADSPVSAAPQTSETTPAANDDQS